ncbi:OsmC family protein [Agrobacterium larrymoorei]|uniref:OsmC family protein n=1 Tax=Agrobacterium larrymoorei TaxID=160699 RepID=UPI001572FC67|nr:OsmC family protein [Agrobacterium larrymoorei]NTJ41937.1 OsmC family protein [Agrobacterium larrymoorei]
MAEQEHRYIVHIQWTGNRGTGTSGYRDYGRDHVISAQGKAEIAGSSDPAFRGDASRWNPEELLLASVSACHKLWYLHFCAVSGVVVSDYVDEPVGVMVLTKDGGGHFTEVVLKPAIKITQGDIETAQRLHHDAHEKCFIASSVNFPIRVEATIEAA